MKRRCVISAPLTPDRWRRVDELFAAATELEPAAVPRFLDDACGDDSALRNEVESMLRYQRDATDFLETPAIGAATEIWEDGRPADTGVRTPTSGSTQPRHAMDLNSRFIPGDVVAGRYRVVGLLGRGGMGEVYRADDLKLSQPVALKFLAESLSSNGAALARFHREVSLARQISHRHVCRVYDIGEHAGMHFLSMEYVRGEELSSLLKRIGRLPADKAVETARQLCAGLAAIHAAGVLHRDLKPANVMIDEQGDVRITDFGVAALSEGVSGREAMIGTPAYMAPEQLEGGELTTRSDIYALGLVLYEAFTGNRAFTATTLPEIVRDRLDVLGLVDVELEHVRDGIELQRGTIGHALGTAEAGQDDLGSRRLRLLGDLVRDRLAIDDSGDQELLALQRTHSGFIPPEVEAWDPPERVPGDVQAASRQSTALCPPKPKDDEIAIARLPSRLRGLAEPGT